MKFNIKTFLLALALALAHCPVNAQTAGVPKITPSVTNCSVKCTPTLTWSTTPAASSCSATWTTKTTASGSQVLPEISKTSTYDITCSWPGVSTPVTVRWTAPTENTDNSPLTNLSGFRVLYGTSATALNLSQTAAGTASSTVVSSLSAGSWFFAVRAVASTGAESDNSTVVTSVVTTTTPTASASTTITVDPAPKPPTGVTATVALALNIPLDSGDGFNRTLAMSITSSGPGVPVGFVKVATPVVGDPVFAWRGQSWCRFLAAHPRTGVPNIEWIKGVSTTTDAAAPCA